VSHKIPALILIAAIMLPNTQCQALTRKDVTQDSSGQPTPQQAVAGMFSENLLTNTRNERMRYLVFVPKNYDKQKKYPLVLWLHGGGSRGDNLKLLLGYGDKHGLEFFARSDNQSKYPSIVVAPQCPLNKLWGNPDSEKPTNEMRLVLEILDKVKTDFSVDSKRIYVAGMSLGGFGTWDIIARRPDVFAAAVPICGGGNPSRASLMIKTAIWAFHGDQDELVNVNESRRMVSAVKDAGGQPKYSEYKGVGHTSWVQAFAEPELLAWLFAQSR
jgi:predicted peptidase